MSDTEKYQPKVGDRVRATLAYEGVVKSLPDAGEFHVRVDIELEDKGRMFDGRRYLDETVWSFEKLSDPEPEWVNGDVVRSVNGDVRVRYQGHWWNPACSPSAVGDYRVSENWQDGTLEILYKADAPKEVA